MALLLIPIPQSVQICLLQFSVAFPFISQCYRFQHCLESGIKPCNRRLLCGVVHTWRPLWGAKYLLFSSLGWKDRKNPVFFPDGSDSGGHAPPPPHEKIPIGTAYWTDTHIIPNFNKTILTVCSLAFRTYAHAFVLSVTNFFLSFFSRSGTL